MIGNTANSEKSKSERRTPIEQEFMKVFLRIRKKLNFASAPISPTRDEWLFDLIQASTSRFVEFKIVANRARPKTESTFTPVSNLRGIWED